MSCEECRELTTHTFRSPEDLVHAVRLATEEMERGVLSRVNSEALGAAGGAMINTVFIGHYQDMARGHFIVRRLEKIHGAEPVRSAYEKL